MKITGKTKINMVIGNPVEHSLSPKMHNAGYEKLNIDDQYVYIACQVDVKQIEDFIKGVRAMNIRGVSCTIPHKLAVITFLDEIDGIAKKIGAVNTIVNNKGKLTGHNTDWFGVLEPLKLRTRLKGKKVALLGAGGTARAAAYAMTKTHTNLMIFNRTVEKAEQLAKEFGGNAYALDEIEKILSADIIINTTSVGFDDKNKTPLPKEYITKEQIVFDVVYGTEETQLIRDAKEQGATTISGIEMLLHQGLMQFMFFTGREAPVDAMRKALI